MTHTLHRIGKKEGLKSDYVILAMLATGINDKTPDARKKLFRIAEIFNQYNPANIIQKSAWNVSPVITANYTNLETVKQVIQTLNQEDLGVSIVISGIISEIQKIIQDVGLSMHTVHLSLGTFGRKELLPSEKILEITTMCGHHCISPQSIDYYIKLIKNGKISVENAAENLSKPCVCGIFNPARAITLLNKLSENL